MQGLQLLLHIQDMPFLPAMPWRNALIASAYAAGACPRPPPSQASSRCWWAAWLATSRSLLCRPLTPAVRVGTQPGGGSLRAWGGGGANQQAGCPGSLPDCQFQHARRPPTPLWGPRLHTPDELAIPNRWPQLCLCTLPTLRRHPQLLGVGRPGGQRAHHLPERADVLCGGKPGKSGAEQRLGLCTPCRLTGSCQLPPTMGRARHAGHCPECKPALRLAAR